MRPGKRMENESGVDFDVEGRGRPRGRQNQTTKTGDRMERTTENNTLGGRAAHSNFTPFFRNSSFYFISFNRFLRRIYGRPTGNVTMKTDRASILA